MASKKPANKISPGRKPKPASNNIRNMNKDVSTNYDKKQLKKLEKKAQQVASKKPVGAKANNAVYSRGYMMGGGTNRGTGLSGMALAAGTPLAKKAGAAAGAKLGKALRPVGRAIDKALGIKSKSTKKKKK